MWSLNKNGTGALTTATNEAFGGGNKNLVEREYLLGWISTGGLTSKVLTDRKDFLHPLCKENSGDTPFIQYKTN